MTRSSAAHPKARPTSFWKHFLIALGVLGATVLLCAALGKAVPRGPLDRLEGAKASLDRPVQKDEYRKLIQEDPENLGNHRGYIQAHFAIPKVQRVGRNRTIHRDDNPIIEEYLKESKSAEPWRRDIGCYGLGFIRTLQGNAKGALEAFGRIAHQDQPFVNNSIGYVYLVLLNEPEEADPYFYKEAALEKGHLSAVASNLSRSFLQRRLFDRLKELGKDPRLGPLVPTWALRGMYLEEGNLFRYFLALYRTEAEILDLQSFLVSLVIALMFLIYVYYLDAFEKERVTLLLGVFAMGMLSAVLCTFLYDFVDVLLRPGLEREGWGSLAFYILQVGLIEETCKALPVLIVVFLLKEWNEPVDILIYASVSALAFACMENTSYFHRMAIGLMTGRAFTAVVMHVCLSVLAVYGIFHMRWKKGKGHWMDVPLYFGAAVLAHGLYDYFLSVPAGLGIFSTLILVYMAIAYNNMMENAQGQSPFFRAEKAKISLGIYLFYGCLGIVLLQFALLAVRYDFDLSFKNLWINLYRYYFIIFIVAAYLGNLDVIRGKWRPLIERKKKGSS